jgi:peptidoglycan/xylan/chitin deacetylase (PgdA/CDA1 family)
MVNQGRPQNAAEPEAHAEAAGQVTLFVGIDTEADDQWSAQGRRELAVRNAERLPALQALFDRFGVRPVYFVTWEMASTDSSAGVLRSLAAGGRCEIGSHLHPWSMPASHEANPTAHTFPHNLPPETLERQLDELTGCIETRLGVRPRSYRAGRNGFDHRSLPVLEKLGYTVDSSVDPLFNERRKGGMVFAGAPLAPYRPDYADVRRPGASRILEIPISAATIPALPRPAEALFTTLPPLPYRGLLRRLGLRGAWLRPSYSSLDDMRRLATRLAARVGVLNIAFHSSELLPGGSPYTPDEASVARFLDDLARLLEHATERLFAVGRTYGEYAATWDAESRRSR